MRRIPPVLPLLILVLVPIAAADSPAGAEHWHGYVRQSIAFEGQTVQVIAPHHPAQGRPWIWKARFLDHSPDLDLALLELGFHVVFMDDSTEQLGSPACVEQWSRLHDLLTKKFSLAQKAALEGVSRGGLYVYNFAAAHPDKVACIVADGAVCDFRSWPAGGKIFPGHAGPGSAQSWALMKKAYGFASDDDARAWKKNPVDHLEPLAKAKIPVFHVVGADDPVVPVSENTALIEKRYRELGGTITVVAKPGEKHAHGVVPPAPLIDFVVKSTCGWDNTRSILHDVRRIVFLGDSITHGGTYIDYVDGLLRTRYPQRQFELINLGLSSETTSGLSEDGHAGGKFPRPCVHERLGRVLERAKPDLVIACYGINDGIYMPFDEQRFAKFREGMTKLVATVRGAGAQIIILTPPVFDALPIAGKTTTDGVGGPFRDYDQVMTRYSQWLLEQRQAGWRVADIHGPMLAHALTRRASEPSFTFSKDGVHPGPAGHWMMALAVIQALGPAAEVDVAQIEANMPRIARGWVFDVKTEPGSASFKWRTHVPMPLDPQWDAKFLDIEKVTPRWNFHRLSISGLRSGQYRLGEKDQVLGEYSHAQLAGGLDLGTLENLSINKMAPMLRKLISQRNKLLGDAWRTHVGHQRPGVAAGLPLEQAQAKAAELDQQLRELCEPKVLKLQVVKVER